MTTKDNVWLGKPHFFIISFMNLFVSTRSLLLFHFFSRGTRRCIIFFANLFFCLHATTIHFTPHCTSHRIDSNVVIARIPPCCCLFIFKGLVVIIPVPPPLYSFCRMRLRDGAGYLTLSTLFEVAPSAFTTSRNRLDDALRLYLSPPFRFCIPLILFPFARTTR